MQAHEREEVGPVRLDLVHDVVSGEHPGVRVTGQERVRHHLRAPGVGHRQIEAVAREHPVLDARRHGQIVGGAEQHHPQGRHGLRPARRG